MIRPKSQHTDLTRAIGFMIASTACFSLMNVFIREVSMQMHTTQIVFLRNFLCIFLLFPFMIYANIGFKTEHLRAHFWRATVGIIGMETWFYSISILPLNQATALSYTAPLFTTLFAIFYLKERGSIARWLALIIGFIGAMIILHPTPAHFDERALIVLFATSMWAVAGMMVKTLTRTEPALRIVFIMSVFMSLWALPLALYHWHNPSLHLWGLVLVIATASVGAQWCLAKAYSLADVSSLTPYDFGRLIFTSFFAYIAFGETSDINTWIGASIIVASAAFIARYEYRHVNRS